MSVYLFVSFMLDIILYHQQNRPVYMRFIVYIRLVCIQTIFKGICKNIKQHIIETFVYRKRNINKVCTKEQLVTSFWKTGYHHIETGKKRSDVQKRKYSFLYTAIQSYYGVVACSCSYFCYASIMRLWCIAPSHSVYIRCLSQEHH